MKNHRCLYQIGATFVSLILFSFLLGLSIAVFARDYQKFQDDNYSDNVQRNYVERLLIQGVSNSPDGVWVDRKLGLTNFVGRGFAEILTSPLDNYYFFDIFGSAGNDIGILFSRTRLDALFQLDSPLEISLLDLHSRGSNVELNLSKNGNLMARIPPGGEGNAYAILPKAVARVKRVNIVLNAGDALPRFNMQVGPISEDAAGIKFGIKSGKGGPKVQMFVLRPDAGMDRTDRSSGGPLVHHVYKLPYDSYLLDHYWANAQNLVQRSSNELLFPEKGLSATTRSQQTTVTDSAFDQRTKAVFEYGKAGNLKKVEYADGRKFLFEMDSTGQLSHLEAPHGTYSWEHDLRGRQKTATSELGTVHYSYDRQGRVQKLRVNRPSGTHVVGYRYDLTGSVSGLSVMDKNERLQYSIRLDRDSLGRVSEIKLGGQTVSFKYDTNKVVRFTPDKVRSTFRYDVYGLLSSVRHEDVRATSPRLISNTTFLRNASYQSISVGMDVPGMAIQFRDFKSGTDHLLQGQRARVQPVFSFESSKDLIVGANGHLLSYRSNGQTQDFLRMPVAQGMELLLMDDGKGGFRHASVVGERLAFEHDLYSGVKILHLEHGFVDSTKAIEQQMLQAPVIQPSLLFAQDSWNTQLFKFDQQFRSVANPVNDIVSLTKSGLELAQASDLSRVGLHVTTGLELPEFELKQIGKLLNNVQLGYKGYQDVNGFMQSNDPSRWKQHVFFGQLSEHMVGWGVGHLLDSGAEFGTPAAYLSSEYIGLAFNHAREGRDLRKLETWGFMNPDNAERYLDMMLLAPAYGLAYAIGVPRAAIPIANVLNSAAKIGRPSTFAFFNGIEQRSVYFGAAQQGQHVWELAMGALSGDTSHVLKARGLFADRTTSLRPNRARTMYGKLAQELEAAAYAGDVKKVAAMLPRFNREIGAAGYTLNQFAELKDALSNAQKSTVRIPRGNLQNIQQHLGGVAIEAKLEFAGDIGNIYGAVYDPIQGYLVLVGDGAPAVAIDPDYLAVAIYCIFKHGRGPQFSLDPADPTRPAGRWQKAVYIPDSPLRNSRFGHVMWLTDWAMKQAAFGTEVRYGSWLTSMDEAHSERGFYEVWTSGELRSFTLIDHDRRNLGFDSVADITFAHPNWLAGEVIHSRQWILVKNNKVNVQVTDGALVFDPIKLDVKAKRMQRGPSGMLHDVEVDEKISNDFAKQFGDALRNNLKGLAEREPAFAELPILVKSVAFARWLRDQHIPIDFGWVNDRLNLRRNSVHRVTTLATEHISPHGDWALSLSGGINLDFRLEKYRGNGVHELKSEVAEAMAQRAKQVFALADGKKAIVLPFTKAGRILGRRSKQIVRNGFVYQLNADGQVDRVEDPAGNLQYFTWHANGDLKVMTERTPNGWQRKEWRVGGTKFVEHSSPRQPISMLATSDNGSKTLTLGGKVRAGGKQLANGNYEVQDVQDVYRNVTILDTADRVISQRRYVEGANGMESLGSLEFDYSNESELSRVKLDGKLLAALSWKNGHVASLQLNGRRWSWQYDTNGRLQTLNAPGGDFLKIIRGEEGEMTLEMRYFDEMQKFVYSRGLLRSSMVGGQTTIYAYDNNDRIIWQSSDKRPLRTFEYDTRGRLTSIHIAGLTEFNYQYSKDSTDLNPLRITIREFETPSQ